MPSLRGQGIGHELVREGVARCSALWPQPGHPHQRAGASAALLSTPRLRDGVGRIPRRRHPACGHAKEWDMNLATHEVINQSTPFVDVNLFDTDRALRDALKFNLPTYDAKALSALGAEAGIRRDGDARAPGQRAHPRAAHARPLRPPRRPGGVPPQLSRAAGRRAAPWPARHAVVARRRRARRARSRLHPVDASRAVGVVPGVDELRGDAGAARQRAAVRGLAHRASPARSTTRASRR